MIHLVCAENITIEKLPSKVPKDSGRYHLYRFNHTHEGDYMESIGMCILLLFIFFAVVSLDSFYFNACYLVTVVTNNSFIHF